MKSLSFGSYGNLATSGTRYAPVSGTDYTTWNITEASRRQIITSAGTISGLRINLNGSPGSGKSYAFTLRVNGADSALTATVSDTNTTAVDSTHSVTVAAGDLVDISCVASGTPTARRAEVCIQYEGDTANESQLFGVTGDVSDGYYGFGSGAGSATEIQVSQLFATAGTLKNLYIKSASTMADGGTFTIYKNGSATSLSVTVSAGGDNGSDTTNTVTVAAGDLISFYSSIVGTNPVIGFGATFVADTDNEFPIIAGCSDDPSTSSTEYGYVNQNAGLLFTATESNFNQVTNGLDITNLYTKVTTAPGSGKSWAITLRKNGVDTGLAATTSDTNTTANAASTVSFTAGDEMSVSIAPSGTPSSSGEIHYGFTGKVATPVAAGSRPTMMLMGI